jgi:hypothetical protein
MEDPVVVFIGGAGRSGSTLLGQVLGQLTGFVAVGEMVSRFWAKNLDLHICGCGEPIEECAFWSAVAERTEGGWHSPEFARTRELQATFGGSSLVPLLLLLPWQPRSVRRKADEMSEHILRLYRSVADVAGANVIVDGSKDPAYAVLLHRVLGTRLRLVHLVRHSGGVAFSWTKIVSRPLVGRPEAEMTRYRPGRTALRWLRRNLMLDLLRKRSRAILLRYEDLARDPGAELLRVCDLAGSGKDDVMALLGGDMKEISTLHTCGGNPMRFQSGALSIRLDEAWRHKLSFRQRALVTTVSSPLLLRYGYLGPLARPSN